MTRASITTEGVMTLTAAAAIGAHERVKLAASQTMTPAEVEQAGAGEQHVGIAEYAAGIGETVAVRLRNAEGTRMAIADGAIAQGAVIYGGAAGKVSASVSGTAIGVALAAATADGDVIEILEDNGGL